jgi:hypothetical protein
MRGSCQGCRQLQGGCQPTERPFHRARWALAVREDDKPVFRCVIHGAVLSRGKLSAISMPRSSAAYTVDVSSSPMWLWVWRFWRSTTAAPILPSIPLPSVSRIKGFYLGSLDRMSSWLFTAMSLSSMVTSGGACHGVWTNAFRLFQFLTKVLEGAVRHSPASIGVHPDQSLSSNGRRRSIVGGTASVGPVRSLTAVSLTRRFI